MPDASTVLITFIFIFRRHRSQRATPVYLRAGRVYFLEALMVDAGGPDHLTVGVRLPNGRMQRPVSSRNIYRIPPGTALIYFVHTGNFHSFKLIQGITLQDRFSMINFLNMFINPPYPFSIVLNRFWFLTKDPVRVLKKRPGSSL